MPVRKNPDSPYWRAIEAREREVIEGALTDTAGNITRAAMALGIHRTHLTTRIRRLGIDRAKYENPKA